MTPPSLGLATSSNDRQWTAAGVIARPSNRERGYVYTSTIIAQINDFFQDDAAADFGKERPVGGACRRTGWSTGQRGSRPGLLSDRYSQDTSTGVVW